MACPNEGGVPSTLVVSVLGANSEDNEVFMSVITSVGANSKWVAQFVMQPCTVVLKTVYGRPQVTHQ
jgi:hypothetical protein